MKIMGDILFQSHEYGQPFFSYGTESRKIVQENIHKYLQICKIYKLFLPWMISNVAIINTMYNHIASVIMHVIRGAINP